MIDQKYKIKNVDSDNIDPEETLLDTFSRHPSIEIPIGKGVFNITVIVTVFLFVFLSIKAFDLQIVKGEKYESYAKKNAATLYPLPALRGIIKDVNNKPIANNSPSFDLIAVHSALPQNESELNYIFSILGNILDMQFSDIESLFLKNKDSASFVIKNSLSKEQVAKIKALSIKGVYLIDVFRRNYVYGPIMSTITGYISKVNANDMESDDYYLLTDWIGKLGLESYYENELRGEHRELDLKSQNEMSLKAKSGNDLTLHLDSDVQSSLHMSLNNVLKSNSLKKGVAVMQNIKNGAILGMVSLPSFDPNIFEDPTNEANKDKINKILNDKNQPFFNRAVSGRYSPGSTIKPLLALAGLKEGAIDTKTVIYAGGSISISSVYDPTVVYVFNDWKVHGWTDVKKAIADSVDIFFYALGGGYERIQGLGINKILKYYNEFGAGEKLFIDLPNEVSGFVPSPDWKKREKNENWFIGDTYNISIGLGDFIVTPLWLNGYTASLINGGLIMKPSLVKEIKDFEGNLIWRYSPEILRRVTYDNKYNLIIKEAMAQTVESGTGKILSDLPVKVGAKTGTAQITGQDINSLLTVFGPYENPEFVLTVLIEDVESQGLALYVAKDFLSWYFSNHNYPQPE